jgi:hypothetical protein
MYIEIDKTIREKVNQMLDIVAEEEKNLLQHVKDPILTTPDELVALSQEHVMLVYSAIYPILMSLCPEDSTSTN